ncbi:xpg i-region protein [Teratosphaeria destructans]|uniref:Xpg i-region protein n=1 Tax=Teratosphaeria destructans TaxID=418781 RepID=A0A9W7SWD6_9PEZI|nr:xpg i-region protein [Teratosphaeria destructans]
MAFREWAQSEGLTTSGDLDQFRGITVAIDAQDYLDTLLTNSVTREPLLPAHGGLPFALRKHVDADIQGFQDAGIEPLFIFNGLEVACRDRAIIFKEARKATNTLNEAWSVYDEGRGDEAVMTFGKACTYRTAHISRWLHAYLHKAGVFVQIAPYSAAAQTVYLETNSYVHAVAGSASTLVYGADKVVTKFDWAAKKAVWVDMLACTTKLGMHRDQFNDLMLLSGCSLLPAISEVDAIAPVQNARTLLSRCNNDGHTVCLQHKDEDYLSAFRKAKSAIKHAVIMNEDGKIIPKDEAHIPNDVHDFVGQRLPEEVLFYLSRGLVGPRVLTWRTRTHILEIPPLDGGMSMPYKNLVQDKLRPLHAQALALITKSLHRYYQKTDIELICWFNENERGQLGLLDLISNEDSDVESSWHLQETALSGIDGEVLGSPLSYVVGLLSDEAKATATNTKRTGPGMLSTPKELVVNSVARFLHDRGYINPNHTLSAYGRALKASLDRAKSNGYAKMAINSVEVEETVLMAFELLRLDLLNNKPYFQSPPYSGQPLQGTETDKANTLLVSRIASLGLCRHKQIGYTGPLSRNLLAYQQMTAAVRESLRDLLEMHACNMLLSGTINRSIAPEQLTNLGTSLPFVREPDVGLSLMVKSYLDVLSQDSEKRPDATAWFTHAISMHADLNKAWKMWDAINVGIQAADSSIVNNETRKLFKNADEWLEKKKAAAPTTNGVHSDENT